MNKYIVAEYLAAWETIHNTANFNSLEFEGIRKDAGSNRFLMSVTQWVSRTHAVGIRSKAGRYGGTEAHADIEIGFNPKDLFILLAKMRMVPDWHKENQFHARKFHCYYWIFIKEKSRVDYNIATYKQK